MTQLLKKKKETHKDLTLFLEKKLKIYSELFSKDFLPFFFFLDFSQKWLTSHDFSKLKKNPLKMENLGRSGW